MNTGFLTNRCAARCPRSWRLAVAMVLVVPTIAAAETWTSLDGSRSVRAKLVGVWDNHAILLLDSGTRVSVPMDSLIAGSRIQAETLAEKMAEQRKRLSDELQAKAIAEAAPAPDPLPTPPPIEPLAELSDSMTAGDAVRVLQNQLAIGHFAIAWDGLPPSQQAALQTLVRLAAKKLDAASVDASLASLHRLADLIVTHERWVASHPRFRDPVTGEFNAEAVAMFRDVVLPLAGAIRAGLPPEQANVSTIATSELGPWLRERDQAMAPYLAGFLAQSSSGAGMWDVDSTGDDAATMKLAAGSGTAARSGASVRLSKVDGRWIPESLAKGFDGWIETETKRLEQQADGSMTLASLMGDSSTSRSDRSGAMAWSILDNLPALDGMIAQLATAPDATTFHQSSEIVLSGLQSAIEWVRGTTSR